MAGRALPAPRANGNPMNTIMESNLTPEYVDNLARQHRWAATGVSDYPPRDPLVGQSRFFRRYRTFIQTVDQEADHFAHVFAVEGEWGRGKSRLGHELIAQINDCSKGWFVRGAAGQLGNVQLFEEAARDQYLGLYLRYSQVASDYQNSDNWFGFGLYKALLPLATKVFDGSIQSEIAKQALARLEPYGFAPERLRDILELDQAHSEELLYEDPNLVTGLVQQAYEYLKTFGIRYLLVVLDELETVAEAATFGLEQDDAKRLDGQAIRLIGRAIKEEDPRRKLPWLRYVALCSPLLGQQLREIQSTARRFELAELEHNAFADVSDYVAELQRARKLRFDYPVGLVEAAYAMSGANFGWFNVVMANIDVVLEDYAGAGKGIPPTGDLFEEVLNRSGRVSRHVLDAHAIEGIKTGDHQKLAAARRLLFGQLPMSLQECDEPTLALLDLENEDGEPVASRYRKVRWDPLDCRRALEEAKFQRHQDEWFYPSVEQGLNLSGLLQNLRTFAIKEADSDALLIPLAHAEFRHLLALLYDHPAAEFAADALWQKLVGSEKQLSDGDATHIGPSVAMLLRLDLRYRSQQHNSMIFRDPELADAHERAMREFGQAAKQDDALRYRTRLTGLFRLLDRNWLYAQEAYPNRGNLVIQIAPRGQGQGQRGGLQFCEGLKLHPDNQAWFAWINSKEELQRLHEFAGRTREDSGRIPVMAFTTSIGVADFYQRGGVSEALKGDILLYPLNSSEADQLERIGLLPPFCQGFSLGDQVFTTKFKNRLNALRDYAYQAIHVWRRQLNSRGLIAWPLRPLSRLSPEDREMLFAAWQLLALSRPEIAGLHDLQPEHGLDAAEVAALFSRLAVGGKVQAAGYEADEHAGLFIDLGDPSRSQARVPAFLARIANPAKEVAWTLDRAKREWYWGYLWSGNGLSAKSVFEDWMWWCTELHLLKVEDAAARQGRWISVLRAELENSIKEAMNWFDGPAQDGYRATIKILERVFGADLIPGLFSPMGSAKLGTETVEASDQLRHARQIFDRLRLDEEVLANAKNLDDIVQALPALLRARADLLHQVGRVKPAVTPAVRLDNLKTIRLNDKRISLYERVCRARLFAEYVEQMAKAISGQVDALIEQLEADCRDLPHFPKNLFTLSLETIRSILAGALHQAAEGDTVLTEAQAGSDTLLHFLRSLQLDKAAERLERLAEETGVDPHGGAPKPFGQVTGHIIESYRQFKDRYQATQESMRALRHRLGEASRILEPLPVDYGESCHPGELITIQQKLSFVSDAFENLADDAGIERERFSPQARKGKFDAIREIPERLIKSIREELSVLGGATLKIEHCIEAYRSTRLEEANGDLPCTLNPLFAACRETPIATLLLNDIRGLSLHDLDVHLELRTQEALNRADKQLSGTGISVDRWRAAARSILAGKAPLFSAEELALLVERGIVKVRVGFGEPG